MNRLLILVSLFLFIGSYSCAMENETLMSPASYQADQSRSLDDISNPCVAAQQHVNQCLGNNETPLGSCDQEAAEVLFSMSCQELRQAEEDQKADGTSWLDRLHCRIGVLHFCPVPECEEEINPNLSQSCTEALESGGCAQCDYYACLEESAQCGSDGYLLDFVGKYCYRFTQVTYPRITSAGQEWMDGVRECLITNMEAGYYEGESCESLERRGIDDHISCYVDNGICSLPLGDWLKIMATIPPHELPLLQALSVGGQCIKGFLKL